MSVTSQRSESAVPADHWHGSGMIPRLESGDRLTADEFMRRYEAMPDLKKAELIEGVVYVSSPVTQRYHGNPHVHVLTWLGNYEAGTPGVESGDNSTVCLDIDSVPQPDCLLFVQAEFGGRVRINEEGYIVGAPELIAEIAASSVSYDLHDKLRAYKRNGVREYIVWRVLDQQIDWFVLGEGHYEPLPAAADGTLHSPSFPGLWLDPAALLRGDLAGVLAVVEQGLNSPEHSAFKLRLERAGTTPAG